MQEWQYEYNADGLRTKRTNGYSTYEYVYLNGQLVRMLVDGNTLSFHYDADGKPMSFVYNGTTYYYATNLQGDIVAILSKEGTQVVSYSYDAWGNILSITGTKADTIGKYNPLRYRGYVYDTESKLYYLQSRYYDPAIGRFINADTFATTGQGLLGNNMFAYCGNNSVNNIDPLGLWTINVSGTVSGVFGLGTSLSAGFAFDDNGNFDWQYSYAIPGVDDTSMVGGIGIGGGLAVQFTQADTVYDLYGLATYIGASAGPGWYVGGDIVSFSDASDSDMTTDGFQLYAGYGGALDVHVIESFTRSFSNTTKPAQSGVSISSVIAAICDSMIYY